MSRNTLFLFLNFYLGFSFRSIFFFFFFPFVRAFRLTTFFPIFVNQLRHGIEHMNLWGIWIETDGKNLIRVSLKESFVGKFKFEREWVLDEWNIRKLRFELLKYPLFNRYSTTLSIKISLDHLKFSSKHSNPFEKVSLDVGFGRPNFELIVWM